MSEDSSTIVDLALERGLISKEQAQECRTLGEMLERGHLTREQADQLSTEMTRVQAGRPSSAQVLDPGTRVGRYEIIRFLSKGGMGTIYLALDPAVRRTVALKLIPREMEDDATAQARFQREVGASAHLAHPNIVRLFDVGEEPQFWYYTMEYIDGPSLARVMEDARPLPPRTAMRVARDVARALAHAHEKGIIHRDIKPGNILLVGESALVAQAPSDSALAMQGGFVAEYRALLADFGLAREVHAGTALTLSGDVLGTPLYMSPEQAAGRSHEADARSDVYSLGAVLYKMLTGQAPSRGKTTLEILEAIRTRDPISVRKLMPQLSRDAETIVMKALCKEPERRYATAGDFADDIERYLRGEAVRARPPSLFYRMRKTARRRPAATTVAVMVTLGVLATLGYFGGPTWIEVTSEPKNARVLVNDEFKGFTPLTIKFRSVREAKIQVEHDGFVTKKDGITPTPWRRKKPKHYVLVDAFGTLKINVDPKTAEVVLVSAGGPPLRFPPGIDEKRVKTGTYQVDITAPDHRPRRTALTIPPGETAELSVTLEHEYGFLTVDSETEGVTMLVYSFKGGPGTYVPRPCSLAEVPAADPRVSRSLPVGLLKMNPGRYRLFFMKQNHIPRSCVVTIGTWDGDVEPRRSDRKGPVLAYPPQAGHVRVHVNLEPMAVWSFRSAGVINSRAAVEDLDGDGTLDCIVAVDPGKVTALSGLDGHVLWMTEMHDVNWWFPPVLGELDGDGTADCILASNPGKVVALSGRDGRILWKVDTFGSVNGSSSLADLNGDRIPDCVVALKKGKLIALSGSDGRVLWEADAPDDIHVSSNLGDLDGDGTPDCLVGADQKVAAHSGVDGRTLWRKKSKHKLCPALRWWTLTATGHSNASWRPACASSGFRVRTAGRSGCSRRAPCSSRARRFCFPLRWVILTVTARSTASRER